MRPRIARSALLASLLFGAGCGPDASATTPRGLLLVTIDTLRADCLGAYGYARETTPHIDALAREAWVFDRAYSTSSWTLPALASLLTALHPATHDCLSNRSRLSPDVETLAERLSASGFRTGAVTSHVYMHPKYRLDQGFDDYDAELVRDDFEGSHRAVTSARIADKGIAWLEDVAGSDDDWFLWLHFFDPHADFLGHAGFLHAGAERDGPPRRRYDSEIAWTDHHVGRVLDRLEELGLERETIVVLTADHGEEFGDHGNRGHRRTLYEEVVRVPLLLRAPGHGAGRSSLPVSLVDLLPTVCSLLEVPPPRGGQGVDLAPLLRGEPVSRGPVLLQLRENGLTALVSGDLKLVHSRRDDRRELYDLALDPEERNDLADAEPALADELSSLRATLLAELAAARERLGEEPPLELSEPEVEGLRQLGYFESD